MKIYVDEEFTGLTKDTDLISIGLVAENGATFYGEIKDFDITAFGNQYYQDDYDYSVDQATSNMSTEAKAKLSEVLFQIRKAGFTINEYKIEEY